MSRRYGWRVPIGAALFFAVGPAFGWTHIARSGETLEQLAMKYFGKAELSMVIRAANGFVHPDDGSLTRGERIEIPEVYYHRVQNGEAWSELADRFLGSVKRGRFLAEMNDRRSDTPPAAGEIVRIPYQLLHIMATDETLRSVARLYYGRKRSSKWLKRYNLTDKKKFGRGEALLVPLVNIELVAAERERIDRQRSTRFSIKDRQNQIEAAAEIARLKHEFETGMYVEMVATANRLIGRGGMTGPQMIGVYQFLAFAYVALDKNELAIEYFMKALRLQPTMDLSPITTSPKILAIFHKAKNTALLDNIAKTLDAGPAEEKAVQDEEAEEPALDEEETDRE